MSRRSNRNDAPRSFNVHFLILIACLIFISLSKGLKLTPSRPKVDWSDAPPVRLPANENDDQVDVFLKKHQHRMSRDQRKTDMLGRHQERTMSQRTKAIFFNQKYGGGGGDEADYSSRRGRPNREKYPNVLYFVHIHKSAGSLICHLAGKNGVHASVHSNCNVQSDQRCCGKEDTLEAQLTYAKETTYDLVAIEREMYDSLAPESYDYIASIRNSKARYHSHWSHLRRLVPVGGTQRGGFGTADWIVGNITVESGTGPEYGTKNLAEGEDPLGSFQEWAKGQPDNWNTRIFCGPKCRWRPKYQITPQLFNDTLARLAKFSHFIFVEDIENSFNQLAAAYGWRHYTKGFQRNVGKDKGTNLQDEAWDPLMSPLDDALYEFARRKFRNDTEHLWDRFTNQEQVDRYFAEGPKYGCPDACCGKCAAYR
jgi:hypothetical protein